MSRRPDPRQLWLAGMERTAPPPRPADPPGVDPWAGVRIDALVAALVDTGGYSARGLAKALVCSPATVARLRIGHPSRTALRHRLIRLAWRELTPDRHAAARLLSRPADSVRWYAGRRLEAAHALEREPAGPEVASLCGYRIARTVPAHRASTPDGFAALCPPCLALQARVRWRSGLFAPTSCSGEGSVADSHERDDNDESDEIGRPVACMCWNSTRMRWRRCWTPRARRSRTWIPR